MHDYLPEQRNQVKPSRARAILFGSLAVICLLVVGYAVLKSSSYQAPKKPAVTQAEIAENLGRAKPPAQSSKPAEKGQTTTPQSKPKQTADTQASTSQTSKASQPPLAESGPGSTILLFSVATLCGVGFAYYRQLRPLRF